MSGVPSNLRTLIRMSGGFGEAMSDVEVKESGIEGLGVFAKRPFRTGERIRQINIVREVTPDAPIREDMGERIDHCAYPDGRVVLYGAPDRYINHSCDPNAYESYDGGVTYLVARRAIAAGSEITCDFFRLPIAWQREYRPLLSSWFVDRNRSRVAALDALERSPSPQYPERP